MNLAILKAGLNFIYPPVCFHCGQRKDGSQKFLCISCWNQLKPYTPEHDFSKILSTRMTGRFKAEHIDTLFWYQHSSPLKTVLKELKYGNKKAIGLDLGNHLGRVLSQKYKNLGSVFWLIPIPLHPLKQIDRGYNQAEVICRGILKADSGIFKLSEKPVLIKSRQTESQTKKDRFSRWTNQKEVFQVNPDFSSDLNHQNLILVDDIITTGATLEHAGKLILSNWPEAKISIATIAVTE
ncbi:MAG: double zinc ribbon domain-containing protein [Bacteroidetes bacterium]|nr:double zinc ribbon domain-containing protein [Bacteroidota bacterium]